MSRQDGTTHPEQSARDQLLAAIPMTERQLQLAGVPLPYWKAATVHRSSCCTARVSLLPSGRG